MSDDKKTFDVSWGVPTDTVPVDAALEIICKELGLTARPGGASPRGWSTRSVLQSCPYKYKKLYLDEPSSELTTFRSTALEVGGLYHQLLAFHYLQMMPQLGGLPHPIDYDWVKRRLLEEKVDAAIVMESYRLFDAYSFHYENDYIDPVAVEIEAAGARGHTCRYDTIVQVRPNEIVAPGTYILEHKTAARFDFATLESWKNDGQIIGQMMIWEEARLDRTYGDLAGIIINLVSKTKTPDFRRTVIAPQRKLINGHAADLKVYDALEALFAAAGCWPRNRAACRGPYGLCSLHDHCAGE